MCIGHCCYKHNNNQLRLRTQQESQHRWSPPLLERWGMSFTLIHSWLFSIRVSILQPHPLASVYLSLYLSQSLQTRGTPPLYLSQSLQTRGTPPLYLSQSLQTRGTPPLYLSQSLQTRGTPPLYLSQSLQTRGTPPLYLSQSLQTRGTPPLYLSLSVPAD